MTIVRSLRCEAKLSQKTAAAFIGVGQATYSRIENGEVEISEQELRTLLDGFKNPGREFSS